MPILAVQLQLKLSSASTLTFVFFCFWTWQVKNATFRNGLDGLYGVFDGGNAHQISYFLRNNMAPLVQEEFCLQQQVGDETAPLDYLKHSFLTAHG